MGQDLGAFGYQVLNKGSLLIDVEKLAAEADGQDGFSHFETVVKDLTVGLLAMGVERGGFGVDGGVIAGRIDVGRTSRQNKPI